MKVYSLFTLGTRDIGIYLVTATISALFLAACTTASEVGTTVSLPSATPASAAPRPSPSPTSSTEEIITRVSAISPVTIYLGPETQYPAVGTLEAGANAQVIERGEANWMRIVCPEEIAGDCWVLWDPNSVFLYEGPALTLNIPTPASLKFETVSTETSPDGRWQAVVTKSETVLLGDENIGPWFFYVELKVTSLKDGRTWTPVSEWHGAGLGQEEPPRVFHWSKDGRFLYYTSLSYPDGACVFYDNIGESFDRLDLTDGSVSALQPPYARGVLAVSPDETMIAYLYGDSNSIERHLVVRELATAYGDDPSRQNTVLREIALELGSPTQVSQIAWTPDSKKAMVTIIEFSDYCQPPTRIVEWRLDVVTGEWAEISERWLPTATP